MTGGNHINSYYAQTLTDTAQRPALAGAIETDICIIGGGLAGLHTGLSLAERGRKVVVLEGNRIAWGASGRNGGKVLTGYAASNARIMGRVGLAHLKKMYALTTQSLALVRRRIDTLRIECERQDGVLIASWYDDAAGLREELEFETQELGLRAEFMPREVVRSLFNTPRYYDAQFYPDYFHIHPLNYAMGLARAIEAKGGVLFETSMALSARREKDGSVTVRTEDGSVRAQHIVYCGSAYANAIEPRLKWAAVPVSSYMLVTKPVEESILRSAIRAPYSVYDNRWACDYYCALHDNRILWGGGVGIGNKRMPHNLEQKMLGSIVNTYPQLEGALEAESLWVGTMASTVHRVPHIGRFDESIWYCTNFGNNGLGPSAAGGEAIAAGITGEDERWRLFEPFGLEYAGGFLGPYVAQGIYRFWQLRDKYRQWKHDHTR